MKQPFSEKTIWSFLRQMISALHFLHTRNKPIIHRDISPDNILVTKHDNDELCVALADYDLALEIEGTHYYTANVGRPGYWAPEVRTSMNDAMHGAKYGAKIDIWSLGVVAYTLMTRSDPTHLISAVTDATSEQKVHNTMKLSLQVELII